jgi:hypothetical protein
MVVRRVPAAPGEAPACAVAEDAAAAVADDGGEFDMRVSSSKCRPLHPASSSRFHFRESWRYFPCDFCKGSLLTQSFFRNASEGLRVGLLAHAGSRVGITRSEAYESPKLDWPRAKH